MGLGVGLGACASGPEPVLVPPGAAQGAQSASASAMGAASASSSAASVSGAVDSLGPRPEPSEAPPFAPPTPEVFEGPGGARVWLVERHALPVVAVAVVVPSGAASEPIAQAGLAHVAADMLDEGAGGRDAVAFSSALEAIGAKLSSSVDRDASLVVVESLTSKLPEALGLLGDAVVRPRHDERDWARVSSLWRNAIAARGDDPAEVARVVTAAAIFGHEHPYGHPMEGTRASSAKVKVADVAAWHRAIWRPDAATFVVVGDTTRAAVSELLARSFGGWQAAASGGAPAKGATGDGRGASSAAAGAAPAASSVAPRAVLVERADAPQVVMTVARPGVTAASADLPRLEMLNVAVGGTFTSRLNQNLREDHGWTYGARSRFVAQRGAGMFFARAAVRTDAIELALRETLRELGGVAREGLSDAEASKSRALSRADVVATFGQVGAVARELAGVAGLGLPADTVARSLSSQASATRADLASLAAKHVSTEGATVVLVGPRKAALQALAAAGLAEPELRDVEGKPVAGRQGTSRGK